MEVKTNDNIRSIKPAHFAIWRMDCFYVGVVVSYRFFIKKEVKVPSVDGSMDNNYFFLPDKILFLPSSLLKSLVIMHKIVPNFVLQ